jgi:pantetheine-phosphate adenylyltransferase
MKKCVFAGTFDPPTCGHEKVILNCLKLFDEVVVAVLENTGKSCVLTVDERLNLLKKLFKDEKGVRVISFNGAVVDLLEKENTPFYVRGIRNTIDFEYENQNFFANKKLKDDIITIYMPAEQDMLQVSSTLVRNSVHFKKDYSYCVPASIADDIKNIMEKKDV